MNYITGTHRLQTYFATLDDQVPADNGVRLMDAFVDKFDLAKLGFTNTVHKIEAIARLLVGTTTTCCNQ